MLRINSHISAPCQGTKKSTKELIYYKVLWEGFPPDVATWEPESVIHDDFIDEYEARLSRLRRSWRQRRMTRMRRIQWRTIRAPGGALGRCFPDDAGWLGRAPGRVRVCCEQTCVLL